MIQAYISGSKILSNESEAFALNSKSSFGEKRNQLIEYTSFEALYLIHERKLEIIQGKKKINYDQALSKLKRNDSNLDIKLEVFSYLRKKGYIVKTALKFGADFRVYDLGVKPGQEHARWLVSCFKSSKKLLWQDFAAKMRIANSTRKDLLIALVDEESSISFYEARWIKP